MYTVMCYKGAYFLMIDLENTVATMYIKARKKRTANLIM